MKINPKVVEISPALRSVFVEGGSFKTSIITASLLVPKGKNLGELLVLPKYLTYSTKEYPTPVELNSRLEYLYGAVLDGVVTCFGENSLIQLEMTCIDNKYSLDGEDVGQACLELLLDALFEPDAEGGSLDSDKYELQKRLAVENIESAVNDKRRYAFTRMLEIMCADEIMGITRGETIDAIKQSTAVSAYSAWRELLKDARVQFNFVGSFNADRATELIKERFSQIEREPIESETLFVESAEDVTEVTETMDINQSKLVLGFRSGMTHRKDDMYAEQMMVDIFGGGIYSRLFKNVREKLSLCYYCSASLMREKGLVIVQSGIECSNRQQALDEILNQLEIMKNGGFTDEEFEASKTAICDALSGALDTPDGIDAFLSNKIVEDEIMPIEESIKKYQALTREDVIRVAKRITLDTVYTLAGKEDDDVE